MDCDNKEELPYKEQIKKFLEDKDKYSLFINGEWGVGKTYLWKEIENEISSAKKDFELNKIKLNCFSHLKYLYKFIILIVNFIIKYFSYCEFIKKEDVSLRVVYISLFGKEHYKEILEEIILNSYEYNKLAYFVRNLTFWKISIGSLFQFFIKKDFKNVIVCFDDLERKSDKLNIKDLLGLINKLKEEKCKVVLIGDDSKLNNKKTFDDYKEKCIDLEITIVSKSKDVSQIVKEKCPQINTELIPSNLSKSIKNLRQLNRILSAFNYFHKELHFEEKLKENPDCKDLLIYIFEIIILKISIGLDYAIEINTFKLEAVNDKNIESLVEEYFKNATYLMSNKAKEIFNNELTNYQFYMYRTKFIQILSDSIQTNIFNKENKEKINEMLKYIIKKNKIDDFIDLSGIHIVDFFALTYAYSLHNDDATIEIKKGYVKKYYHYAFLKLLLEMKQNKNGDLLEELDKMVGRLNNDSSEYSKNQYKTPTQKTMEGIDNYYSLIDKLKNEDTTKGKLLYEDLKNNKIASYYLDFLFSDKESQKQFQSLYDEHKKNNNKS